MLPAVGDDHGMVKASEDGSPNAKLTAAWIALSANNSGGRFMSQNNLNCFNLYPLSLSSSPVPHQLRLQT